MKIFERSRESLPVTRKGGNKYEGQMIEKKFAIARLQVFK
jgi:hypothetical protein